MAEKPTAEERLLKKRARELQKECEARGEDSGYQRCLKKAAQERGQATYEAARAQARDQAEVLAFAEKLGAFTDQLGEAAKAYQAIVQKAHTDTASVVSASEALLQHAAQRRASGEEAWQRALSDFLELSGAQPTSSERGV